MKLKQRPEDFSVIESYRFDEVPNGAHYIYRMDKQKLTTLGAVERLRERFRIKRQDVSFCGLKDKQGRTEQLIAIRGRRIDMQDPDLRLNYLGRTDQPLSAKNITSNRFSVIVRDLSEEDVAKLPENIAEIQRVGVVNYFDSQRFGFVKHGQGFVARDLLRGDLQAGLKALIAMPSELDRTEDARVKAWLRENWGDWSRKPPYESWVKYRPILQHLKDHPLDFGGALLKLDRRMRAMVVFEFQSAIWNDAVRLYLRQAVPQRDRIGLKYQLGVLEFPRALPPNMADAMRKATFPLLGPDSTFDSPDVEAACRTALTRYDLEPKGLVVPHDLKAFHFKHEERPLLVFPGKLRASEPAPDEANRGRLKVVLSFTLPPGAYATLVVRRVLWNATEENKKPEPVRRPRPQEAEPRTPPKGFRQKQKERKAARAAARKNVRAPRRK